MLLAFYIKTDDDSRHHHYNTSFVVVSSSSGNTTGGTSFLFANSAKIINNSHSNFVTRKTTSSNTTTTTISTVAHPYPGRASAKACSAISPQRLRRRRTFRLSRSHSHKSLWHYFLAGWRSGEDWSHRGNICWNPSLSGCRPPPHPPLPPMPWEVTPDSFQLSRNKRRRGNNFGKSRP